MNPRGINKQTNAGNGRYLRVSLAEIREDRLRAGLAVAVNERLHRCDIVCVLTPLNDRGLF